VRDFQEEARIVRELTRDDNGPDPFASAVRATRMPMIITDPRLPDNPIVFVNDAFGKLTGYDRSEIMGRNCRFLQGAGTDKADVERVREAIRTREPIELDLLNYKKDGTHFWNRLLVSPVFNDDGVLLYFFASQYDVTLERERLVNLQSDRDALEAEVTRRIAELQESEQRLQFALEAGRLGSWSINLDTYRLTASAECKKICGRAPSDPLTLDDLRQSIHPDDRQMQIDAIDQAIRDRSLLDIEYRLQTPAGGERWVQIRGQASYRADGTPLAIVGTTQDITERRRADEHRLLLANELNHRVKNTLAALQAIVAQTMRRATSVADASTTLGARIQAMAAANDLLISGQFESASLRALIDRALAPFGIEDSHRFRISGEDLSLPPRLVVAFALALHELATNASKYGALSNTDGVVDLSWKLVGSSHPRDLQFTWIETGGPVVQPPERTSFGTQLIQRVLARESGGTANVSYLPEGIVFETVAPLSENADNDNGDDRQERSGSSYPE
jgi:PAS domain S-box-containing protein